ncbi:hypothetical protein AVEN_121336-1, partial [Araneus ventricosus]
LQHSAGVIHGLLLFCQWCRESTTIAAEFCKKQESAQRGARTHDPEIKSLVLYRLS